MTLERSWEYGQYNIHCITKHAFKNLTKDNEQQFVDLKIKPVDLVNHIVDYFKRSNQEYPETFLQTTMYAFRYKFDKKHFNMKMAINYGLQVLKYNFNHLNDAMKLNNMINEMVTDIIYHGPNKDKTARKKGRLLEKKEEQFIKKYQKYVRKYGFRTYHGLVSFKDENVFEKETNYIKNLGLIYGACVENHKRIKGQIMSDVDNGMYYLNMILASFSYKENFERKELEIAVDYFIDGLNGKIDRKMKLADYKNKFV